MTRASVRAPRWRVAVALSVSLVAACSMPNPEFDEVRDETGDVGGTGDGDGEPNTSGIPSTGDGDGDGDEETSGDGDPETSGDGDGEPPDVCPEGLDPCNGTCVDLDRDYANCGQCGHSCVGLAVCAFGGCLPKRYVFVSSQKFAGNFGGSEVANATCNELAGVAQLPGSYRAWLSDDAQIPVESFENQGEAAFIVRNGPIVAYSWSDFVDGQLEAPIDRNEFGDPIGASPVLDCQLEHAVWTGTTNEGAASEPLCASWAANDLTAKGVVGDADSTVAWSESDCLALCATELPVYCVQE